MEEHLDFGFQVKYDLEKSKNSKKKESDPYAVEPWEKNTVQYEKQQVQNIRPFKTFYKTKPSIYNKSHLCERNYATQRVFSFEKELSINQANRNINQFQGSQKKSVDMASRVSFVSHYNINGNMLSAEQRKKEERNFNNRFYSQRIKAIKIKNRQKSQKIIQQFDIPVQWAGLRQLKRRISLRKQIAMHRDKEYVRLKSEKSQEKLALPMDLQPSMREKRKSKVLSLGFQKIAITNKLSKQKSVFI